MSRAEHGDDTVRFVVVEFRGGPKDGETELMGYPPSPSLRFAMPVRSAWLGQASDCLTMPVAEEYAMTDRDYEYDIITMVPAMAQQVPALSKFAPFMRKHRPMIYTHRGPR